MKISEIRICPVCEKETNSVTEQISEVITIRDEKIPMEYELFKCLECGEHFDDPVNPVNPINFAFRKYRQRKHMLQPEAITEIREESALSQQEFAKLANITCEELNMYEIGCLQSKEHNEQMVKAYFYLKKEAIEAHTGIKVELWKGKFPILTEEHLALLPADIWPPSDPDL